MVVSLKQTVYQVAHDPIVVEDVYEDTVSPVLLRRLLDSAQGSDESRDCCMTNGITKMVDGTVGVAATYRPDCSLSCLAFATLTRALIVRFSPPGVPATPGQREKVSRGRGFLRDHILCDPDVQLYGYRMDRITTSLFLELKLRINAAVDILSVSLQHDRHSLEAIMSALGGELLLQKENVNALFLHGEENSAPANVAIQAWAVCHAAALTHMASRYAPLSRIATNSMPDIVCNLHHARQRLTLDRNVVSENPGQILS